MSNRRVFSLPDFDLIGFRIWGKLEEDLNFDMDFWILYEAHFERIQVTIAVVPNWVSCELQEFLSQSQGITWRSSQDTHSTRTYDS